MAKVIAMDVQERLTVSLEEAKLMNANNVVVSVTDAWALGLALARYRAETNHFIYIPDEVVHRPSLNPY